MNTLNLNNSHNKKQLVDKIENILKSHKSPYERKIALFNLVKKLEVGTMDPEKKKRTNWLLQGHLYNAMKKIIIETKQIKKAKEVVKEALDREKIEYKFGILENYHKSKAEFALQNRDIKKVMKDFEKAMVKTK